MSKIFKMLGWKKIIQFLFLMMFLISLTILFLNWYFKGIVNFYFATIFLHLITIALLLANLYFFYYEKLKKRIEALRLKTRVKNLPYFNHLEIISKYSFLFGLLFIALSPLLKVEFAEIAIWLNIIIYSLTIVSGFFIFWINSKNINTEIIKEQKKEELIEKGRGEKFRNKFFILNKIPVLKNLARWIYKEGWRYSIGLILIVLVGLMIRLYFAHYFSVNVDEFNHINGAIRLEKDGFTNYKRGLLTTYLIYFLFKILPSTESVARLPSIFFSILSIIFIYKIAKTLFKNKKIAFISSFFYSFTPYVIGLSFYVKEYEIYHFLTVLIVYLSIKTFKQKDIKNILFYNIIAFLILFITYPFEGMGTFPLVVVIYFVLTFLLILETIIRGERKKKKYQPTLLGFFVLTTLVLAILGGYLNIFNLKTYQLTNRGFPFFDVFFNPTKTLIRQIINSPISLILIALILFGFSKAKYLASITLTFITILVMLILFQVIQAKECYVYYLMPFFILSLSFGLYYLIKFIFLQYKNKTIISIFIIMILITLVTPISTLFFQTRQKENTLNGVNYSNLSDKSLIKYLKQNNFNLQDYAVITDRFKLIGFHFSGEFIPPTDKVSALSVWPIENQLLRYDFFYNIYSSSSFYKHEDRIKRIITNNKKGYILLTEDRYNRKGQVAEILLEKKDFYVEEKKVEYIGMIDFFHIFKW